MLEVVLYWTKRKTELNHTGYLLLALGRQPGREHQYKFDYVFSNKRESG
jgi:hypothetical protein